MHLVKVMANPKHKEYKDMREWLGRNLEPEEFNPKAIDSYQGRIYAEDDEVRLATPNHT